MSSFVPLNLTEDPSSTKNREEEHSRELQVEQAFKIFQEALLLHSKGDLDGSYQLYEELFSTAVLSNHYQEESDFICGLQNGQMNTRPDELSFLSPNVKTLRYLVFRNRGLLYMDILRRKDIEKEGKEKSEEEMKESEGKEKESENRRNSKESENRRNSNERQMREVIEKENGKENGETDTEKTDKESDTEKTDKETDREKTEETDETEKTIDMDHQMNHQMDQIEPRSSQHPSQVYGLLDTFYTSIDDLCVALFYQDGDDELLQTLFEVFTYLGILRLAKQTLEYWQSQEYESEDMIPVPKVVGRRLAMLRDKLDQKGDAEAVQKQHARLEAKWSFLAPIRADYQASVARSAKKRVVNVELEGSTWADVVTALNRVAKENADPNKEQPRKPVDVYLMTEEPMEGIEFKEGEKKDKKEKVVEVQVESEDVEMVSAEEKEEESGDTYVPRASKRLAGTSLSDVPSISLKEEHFEKSKAFFDEIKGDGDVVKGFLTPGSVFHDFGQVLNSWTNEYTRMLRPSGASSEKLKLVEVLNNFNVLGKPAKRSDIPRIDEVEGVIGLSGHYNEVRLKVVEHLIGRRSERGSTTSGTTSGTTSSTGTSSTCTSPPGNTTSTCTTSTCTSTSTSCTSGSLIIETSFGSLYSSLREWVMQLDIMLMERQRDSVSTMFVAVSVVEILVDTYLTVKGQISDKAEQKRSGHMQASINALARELVRLSDKMKRWCGVYEKAFYEVGVKKETAAVHVRFLWAVYHHERASTYALDSNELAMARLEEMLGLVRRWGVVVVFPNYEHLAEVSEGSLGTHMTSAQVMGMFSRIVGGGEEIELLESILLEPESPERSEENKPERSEGAEETIKNQRKSPEQKPEQKPERSEGAEETDMLEHKSPSLCSGAEETNMLEHKSPSLCSGAEETNMLEHKSPSLCSGDNSTPQRIAKDTKRGSEKDPEGFKENGFTENGSLSSSEGSTGSGPDPRPAPSGSGSGSGSGLASVRTFLETSIIDMKLSLYSVLFSFYANNPPKLFSGYVHFLAYLKTYLDTRYPTLSPSEKGPTLVKIIGYVGETTRQYLAKSAECGYPRPPHMEALGFFVQLVYVFALHEEGASISAIKQAVPKEASGVLTETLVGLFSVLVLREEEIYGRVHEELGSREMCGASVFLQMGRTIMERYNGLDSRDRVSRVSVSKVSNSSEALSQIISCLHHLNIPINNFFPSPHSTNPQPLTLSLADFALPLCFRQNPMAALPKQGLKALVEQLYEAVGDPIVESSDALRRNMATVEHFLDSTRITPRLLRDSFHGALAVHLEKPPSVRYTGPQGSGEDPLRAVRNGLYFIQALLVFSSYKVRRKNMQSRLVELEHVIRLVKHDLVHVASRMEGWYLLGQAYGFLVEDDLMWTADKLTSPERKIHTANLQRKALLCYLMAISSVEGDRERFRPIVGPLMAHFVKEMYSACMRPMEMHAFEAYENARFIRPSTFVTVSKSPLSLELCCRVMQQSLVLAIKANPSDWANYYYLAKVQRKLKKPADVVLDTLNEAAERTGGIEAHYAMCAMVYKYVKRGEITVEGGEQYLRGNSLFGERLSRSEQAHSERSESCGRSSCGSERKKITPPGEQAHSERSESCGRSSCGSERKKITPSELSSCGSERKITSPELEREKTPSELEKITSPSEPAPNENEMERNGPSNTEEVKEKDEKNENEGEDGNGKENEREDEKIDDKEMEESDEIDEKEMEESDDKKEMEESVDIEKINAEEMDESHEKDTCSGQNKSLSEAEAQEGARKRRVSSDGDNRKRRTLRSQKNREERESEKERKEESEKEVNNDNEVDIKEEGVSVEVEGAEDAMEICEAERGVQEKDKDEKEHEEQDEKENGKDKDIENVQHGKEENIENVQEHGKDDKGIENVQHGKDKDIENVQEDKDLENVQEQNGPDEKNSEEDSNEAVNETISPDTPTQTLYRLILVALRTIDDHDKKNWHHKPRYRLAKILYEEFGDVDGAIREMQHFISLKQTSKPLISIWKPDNERPGKHFYYTYEYCRFFIELLTQSLDVNSLVAMLPKLKRSNSIMVNLNPIWETICSSICKIVRVGLNYDEGDEEGVHNFKFTDRFIQVIPFSTFTEEFQKMLAQLNADGMPNHLKEYFCFLHSLNDIKKANNGFGPTSLIDDTLVCTFLRIYLHYSPTILERTYDYSGKIKKLAKRDIFPFVLETLGTVRKDLAKLLQEHPNICNDYLKVMTKKNAVIRRENRERRKREEEERRIEEERKREEEKAAIAQTVQNSSQNAQSLQNVSSLQSLQNVQNVSQFQEAQSDDPELSSINPYIQSRFSTNPYFAANPYLQGWTPYSPPVYQFYQNGYYKPGQAFSQVPYQVYPYQGQNPPFPAFPQVQYQRVYEEEKKESSEKK